MAPCFSTLLRSMHWWRVTSKESTGVADNTFGSVNLVIEKVIMHAYVLYTLEPHCQT